MDKLLSKQMRIFWIVAFLFPYLLGILMGIGYSQGIDLDAFPGAQMFYPAAGAILALLLTRKGDQYIPKKFFVSYLTITMLAVLLVLGSFIFPNKIWHSLLNIVYIPGSIISLVLLLTEKKDKKEAYGLRIKCIKVSLGIILLFLLLYILRAVFSNVISGEINSILKNLHNPAIWITVCTLPFTFIISFLPFFGEEYGWRYYLQPIFQKRFGIRKGVILLGIVWGIWHLPINLFYYSTPVYGFISVLNQCITCIALGIFFAYAYMRTKNIWVPVALHFLNNNLIPVITGTLSEDVIKNQSLTWEETLYSLLINGILFAGFLFSKYFKDKKYLLPTPNERADILVCPKINTEDNESTL